MGNRLAKPVAVSARVFLAAGLGALGWTFLSATTAAASDESAGLPALETTVQTVETPAVELADPAAAAVDAVVGHAASGLTAAVAPAPQSAPADLDVVQEIEAVVQDLDATVEHLDAAVQDAGLPSVLPEKPLTTVTDAVVGRLDEAVDVVTAPIEVVTAPVEQVLEPVIATLRPAVPILPESPAAPPTDSEPAPAEPTPTEPVPTQAEPAPQVAETTPTVATANPKEHFGSAGVEEAPLPSGGPEEFVATAEAVDLQAQPLGQGQSPSLEIMQLPAPVSAASIRRATEVPSPTAGPISVTFPVTNGGSSGGGGGSAGHGSADAYMAGGQHQWLAAALVLMAESTALPASPAFDPGSTPG